MKFKTSRESHTNPKRSLMNYSDTHLYNHSPDLTLCKVGKNKSSSIAGKTEAGNGVPKLSSW